MMQFNMTQFDKLFFILFFCSTLSTNATHINIETIGSHKKIEYTLPLSCSQQLNDLLKNSTIDPYKNWESCRHAAEKLLFSILPDDLKELLSTMRSNNEPTMLIIHNMPIDSYIPPTPKNGNRPPAKTYSIDGNEIFNDRAKGYVSETVLLGLCNFFNAYPGFDENEKDGTYINQIIPVDDINKKKASSLGSEIPFEFHTENVYQSPPPKYLALLCLRGDPKVATRLIFLDALLDYLKTNPHPTLTWQELLDTMKKPEFIMKTGPSFKDTVMEATLPILATNTNIDTNITTNNKTLFRFNANDGRVSGTTETSQSIVDYLRNIVKNDSFKKNYATKITFKSGDLLLFNNWEVMHSRDSFVIDFDNWRWLQRCYIMLN